MRQRVTVDELALVASGRKPKSNQHKPSRAGSENGWTVKCAKDRSTSEPQDRGTGAQTLHLPSFQQGVLTLLGAWYMPGTLLGSG